MRLSPLQSSSTALRVGSIAFLWLCVITVLHAALNGETRQPSTIRMGYMPVITNLAAPLADHFSKDGTPSFEALKFGSFSEMAEAFRSRHIQAAFIIAPVAIALYQQGVPLKVVYVGNRHESTLVVAKGLAAKSIAELAGRTIAVPIRYSGHLLALKRSLRLHGLGDESLRIVELPPPDMPGALASASVDGYFVGEPFASKALLTGTGRALMDVEEIWPGFICNLMIVQEDLVKDHPQWVQRLVSTAVNSGFWARDHMEEAVQIVSRYWGQDPEVIRYAFSRIPGRVRFDLYSPVEAELLEMGREMLQAGLLNGELHLSGMVDDRFAQQVDLSSSYSFENIQAVK
ncbi:MAG: ABC transporter substrate-binding protein [Deltaproteobacteria bacterium]|nr:ABC transporter substrate-binding protein [Deltaproteobacteria bacterium]